LAAKRGIRRLFSWLTVLTAVPVVIAVLCGGYITYRYNLLLNQTQQMVQHSLEVSAGIDDLMLDLQDLETGQRGYLITGEEDYLAPFNSARQRFETDLAKLRKLVGDNESQIAGTDRIAALMRAKLDELEETIRVRREEGFAAAQAIVASDVGKDTMDRIRDEIGAMRARESGLMTARSDRMRHTENLVVLVVAIGITLSLLGRLVALFVPGWWRRWSRSRRRARGTIPQRDGPA